MGSILKLLSWHKVEKRIVQINSDNLYHIIVFLIVYNRFQEVNFSEYHIKRKKLWQKSYLFRVFICREKTKNLFIKYFKHCLCVMFLICGRHGCIYVGVQISVNSFGTLWIYIIFYLDMFILIWFLDICYVQSVFMHNYSSILNINVNKYMFKNWELSTWYSG